MNEISIAIKISNFPFTIEYLTTKFNLQPTHSHLNGEIYSAITSTGNVQKMYGYNYWEYRNEFKTDEWVQILIDKFIEEIVRPRSNSFKEIHKECSIELFVGVNYYNEANPGFHFTLDSLILLAEIGAELDIDLYCFH